jgi:quinol monooxygenase YgiN
MIAMVVRLDVHDGEAAAALDVMLADLAREVTANEPGTLVYVVHTVEGEPLARVLYEVYADEESFQTHQDAAYFQAFLAARAPLMAARRAERLAITAAKGLDVTPGTPRA